MHTFLKILIIGNLIVPILRIVINRYDDLFNDLFSVLILWIASESCHYLIAGFYIFIVLINNLISFFLIGAYVQAIIQGSTLAKEHVIFLCITIFIFLFYSFAVVIVFPAYKEMKAIFYESVGAVARGNNDTEANLRQNNYNNISSIPQNNNNQDLNNQEQNHHNFVPFSGRGVQLG